jgi:predicted DNA-binding ribbon-helix-helix protein
MTNLTEILNAPIVKRSVNIAGHATSVSIEKSFWDAFKDIAKTKSKSVNQLVAEIDEARPKDNKIGLSSAIRLYVLAHVKRTL